MRYLNLLLALLLVAGCSDDNGDTTSGTDGADSTAADSTAGADAAANNPVPAYLKDTWGLTVSGLDNWEKSLIKDKDGTITMSDNAFIEIDGLGKFELNLNEVIIEEAGSTSITFSVTDVKSNEESYFLYDVKNNYVTIGSGEKGVSLSKLQDGTYEVFPYDAKGGFGKAVKAKDGLAALKLVEQYNEFKTIPPQVLLMAFAVAHTATWDGRTPVACELAAAETTPVCTLFKGFCECAACLVLDKKGKCKQCPGL